MCERAVEEKPCVLKFVPDPLKTQKRCDAAVEKDPWLVKYVPDWFITKEHHRVCHGRRGREKRKAQKAKIKEELLPIAWHPSRWWDWCVPQDEKKETEKVWL